MLSGHTLTPSQTYMLWHRPKIYSTVVCICWQKDTLNFSGDARHLTGKNPAHYQNRFITQEGPFGTKCSMSLTDDIGDIPDACRTYMHVFTSLTQKLTKNCVESTRILFCQNEAYLLHCRPINLHQKYSSPTSASCLSTNYLLKAWSKTERQDCPLTD